MACFGETMPDRDEVSRELAAVLGVLAHAERIRIVEELREEERDVNALAAAIGARQARVSQHLALLKAHRLVRERRDGRHVYYHLTRPSLAGWLLDGLRYLESEILDASELHEAIERVRDTWGTHEFEP